MILSMTGYASQEAITCNGVLQVDLRSVNHRYLELQLKLDEYCRASEPMVRESLNAKLGRGKVDCRISLVPQSSMNTTAVLNHQAIAQITESIKTLKEFFPDAQPVNVLDVLRIPGVLVSQSFDAEGLASDIQRLLNAAIDDLLATRAREGAKLKTLVLERLQEVEQHIQKVKPIMPVLIKQYQDKLQQRLADAMLSNDDERIRQEIVLYAQRIDVDEELSRLDAHVSEVRHVLQASGSVGKRLDFLMQEMHREANTLGSKSVAIETTQASMTLKILIEQMREQIQNIE
jgi:uncharacterized protein (TIGR00255 family)